MSYDIPRCSRLPIKAVSILVVEHSNTPSRFSNLTLQSSAIMSIYPNAFPSSVGPKVKAFMEEYFHISNAASTHTTHDAGRIESCTKTSRNILTEDEQTSRNSPACLPKMELTSSQKRSTKDIKVAVILFLENGTMLAKQTVARNLRLPRIPLQQRPSSRSSSRSILHLRRRRFTVDVYW